MINLMSIKRNRAPHTRICLFYAVLIVVLNITFVSNVPAQSLTSLTIHPRVCLRNNYSAQTNRWSGWEKATPADDFLIRVDIFNNYLTVVLVGNGKTMSYISSGEIDLRDGTAYCKCRNINSGSKMDFVISFSEYYIEINFTNQKNIYKGWVVLSD